MKKKVIWLVNYYAMPPQYESRLRTIKFAHYLKKNNYEVKIISASFLHNTDINLINDSKKYIESTYDDLDFIHIKVDSYKNNGLLRFYSLFQFHLKLYFLKKKFLKPDIIVHTVLPPFGNIIYYVAKYFKAKYIVEVLDLWPESFVELGLIKKTNPILSLLYRAEKWIYEKADDVVFSMEGGKDYVALKKWDTLNGGNINSDLKVHYINNGIDIRKFNSNKIKFQLNDIDLENNNIKKIIYLGSIRTANNLIELINAAEKLKENKEIKFFIYGDGDQRESLIEYCKKNNIDNVLFKEKWIKPEYVPYVVSKADVNVLNYMSGSFGNFGGSQSKMFQYMAAGKPICSNLKMSYCQINKNKIGIAKEYSSSEEYAMSLEKLCYLTNKELDIIKKSSAQAVKEFDYESLTHKLINIF